VHCCWVLRVLRVIFLLACILALIAEASGGILHQAFCGLVSLNLLLFRVPSCSEFGIIVRLSRVGRVVARGLVVVRLCVTIF
jgi:hypothetical protein